MHALALCAALFLQASAPAAPKVTVTDFKVGVGEAAQPGDRVTVNYVGTLENGKEFDSTTKEGGKPFVFFLGFGEVIKGWDMGVVGMKPGGVRKLKIPPELAYGAREVGDIPANSTLRFKVELIKVEHPAKLIKVSVTQAGTGDGAKFGDTLELNYRGKLKNGTEFDNSYDRKQTFPVTLGETRVIPGFTLGLIGMKKGEKRTIVIPADLAYGKRAVGPIPADSELTFELELVNLTHPATEAGK